MKKKDEDEEKRGKKEEQTTRSSDPIQSAVNHLHSTIYANLVFLPRISIFFIFILGIVTGITSRKPSLTSFFLPFV